MFMALTAIMTTTITTITITITTMAMFTARTVATLIKSQCVTL
jgi:hypothetical protein